MATKLGLELAAGARGWTRMGPWGGKDWTGTGDLWFGGAACADGDGVGVLASAGGEAGGVGAEAGDEAEQVVGDYVGHNPLFATARMWEACGEGRGLAMKRLFTLLTRRT